MYGSWGQGFGGTAPPVMTLDVGFSRGRKIYLGCLVAVLVVLLVPLALILAMMVSWAWEGGGAGIGGFLSALMVLFFGAVFGCSGWAVLRMARFGGRLEGTELVIQHAIRTKRVDLATAREVSLGSQAMYGTAGDNVYYGGRMPQLHARHDSRGHSAKLHLRTPGMQGAGSWLPPHQLRALADAIMAGQRPEPYAQQAHYAATGLYQVANTPAYQML